jgi:hypothetical protein
MVTTTHRATEREAGGRAANHAICRKCNLSANKRKQH